jgi:hypothetical protein
MTREWDSPESGDAWIARSENLKRADWAEAAVQVFRDVCGGDMDETALTDLVANMGHLCDRLTAERKDFALSFEGMVEEARRHYEAETGEGDGFG